MILWAIAMFSAAQASPASDVEFGNADGWFVQKSAAGCTMIAGYDTAGHQEFWITVEPDRRLSLGFFNSEWKFDARQETSDFAIAVNRDQTEVPWPDLYGTSYPEQGGGSVGVSFDPSGSKAMDTDLRGALGVTLMRGGAPLIELDIADNDKGFALLDSCVASLAP